MNMLLTKTTSWKILSIFFLFDAFSSYYAVKYMHGNEGNPFIAPYVEENPLLFFPIMMIGFFLTYLIYFILRTIFFIFLKRFGFTIVSIEKITLSSIVIFYFSSVVVNNSIFLMGIQRPWLVITSMIIGLLLASLYTLIMIFTSRKNSHYEH